MSALVSFPPAAALMLGVAVLAAIGSALAYIAGRLFRSLYKLLFEPLDYVASACHLLEKAASKRGKVTRNLPKGARDDVKPHPGFPNGWFFIDESAAIERETVRHISMLGLELAVFRDDKGEVHAVDAYCPHIGANMAVGGRVKGNCLECPFHGWQFSGTDGKCQHIPGAKRVPELAQIRSWIVLERNGTVFLWHHVDDKEPDWYPEDVEEYTSYGFTQKCGRTEHVVYSHIQDIPENGADLGHFEPVHRPSASHGSDVREVSKRVCKNRSILSMVWHDWDILSAWKPQSAPDSHIGVMAVAHSLFFGSMQIPMTRVEAFVLQVGPGIVYLKLRSRYMGDLLLCQYVVPEEPLKQRLTHIMYSSPGILKRLHGKMALMAECTMVERDIQIWNNKCYRPKPVFAATAADESLVKFRRWYSQFYSAIDASKEYKAVTKSEDCDW